MPVAHPGMPDMQDLPPGARARVGEARATGTWTSGLSVDELAAIRSVDFEPVGQVMGSAVHRLAWWTLRGGYCGYGSGVFGPVAVRTITSGSAGVNVGFGALARVLYEARRSAMARMAAECAALGGDGVVSVRLVVGPFPTANNILEFQAFGTAVRALGRVRPPRPFLSHLSGQDFAKLMSSGWVPVDMALGISLGIRHDVGIVAGLMAPGVGFNYEVPGWSELVGLTRHEARQHFLADVARAGADGAVVSDMRLRVTEHECAIGREQHDHLAEATILGTAVAAFQPSAPAPPRALTVLSLDPRRRRRAPDADLTEVMPGY